MSALCGATKLETAVSEGLGAGARHTTGRQRDYFLASGL